MYRDSTARPGEGRHKHLGEAETVAVVTRRGMAESTIFVSDDRSALTLAQTEGIGIADTWQLLALAVRVAKITDTERLHYESVLKTNGRQKSRS